MAYSAGLLLNNGFKVEIIDAVALDISIDRFKEMVNEIDPNVILFETTTPTIAYDLELVRLCRGQTYFRKRS